MAPLRSFVVGGAGFIGSHLVDRLVRRGPVVIFDDLSVGRRAYVNDHVERGDARLIIGDARDLGALSLAMREAGGAAIDVVFHLAANPEARWGLERTRLDLEQGTIATYNVLEAMRLEGPRRIVFASSGTVYGETDKVCAEGDLGCLPISLYGASKLAGEALVSAFVECFNFSGLVFRFGNVVGPRGTHGAALDFLKRLRDDPRELVVLGDGEQSKPYLHVDDCADGILFGLERALARSAELPPFDVFNLAPPDSTRVARIAELCVGASPGKGASIRFTGGERGWRGDVPRSRMDASKLAAAGFRVRHTSDAAVALAVESLAREVFGAEAGQAPP